MLSVLQKKVNHPQVKSHFCVSNPIPVFYSLLWQRPGQTVFCHQSHPHNNREIQRQKSFHVNGFLCQPWIWIQAKEEKHSTLYSNRLYNVPYSWDDISAEVLSDSSLAPISTIYESEMPPALLHMLRLCPVRWAVQAVHRGSCVKFSMTSSELKWTHSEEYKSGDSGEINVFVMLFWNGAFLL